MLFLTPRQRLLFGLTVFALALAFSGCSETRKVAESFNRAREEARLIGESASAGYSETHSHRMTPELRQRMLEDAAYFDAFLKRMEERFSGIKHRTAAVMAAADSGSLASTGTVNAEPQWLSGLKMGALIVVPIAVLVGLWATGALAWIRGVLGLVTPRVRAQAKLDAETAAGGGLTPESSAAIAIRRTDPAYNVLYVKNKRRAEKESSS